MKNFIFWLNTKLNYIKLKFNNDQIIQIIKLYINVIILYVNTISKKKSVKNIIQLQTIFYITIIIVFLVLIYINPIILVETLAEQDLEKQLSEIIETMNKLNEENIAIKEDLKATHKLLKIITISLVFVMVLSGYNWEAMYQLKEILNRRV